jgi:beta-glucosidase
MHDGHDPFPADFLWGASTAGHQVEGGNYDQWTVWELEHAVELARTAVRRLGSLPEWQKFKPAATDPENYISGKGVMHYQKYRDDFDIACKIGLNAFRFSIEWSRLEPEIGVWDDSEIDHYHNYIDEMKRRGLEPVLNIWHWTHPVWFEQRGGFSRKENLSFWMRYVQKIADEFGQDVRYVITLNEPNVYVLYGAFNNVDVPPHGTMFTKLLTFWRLVQAHRIAYRVLKRANPDLQVSVAYQMSFDAPKDPKKFLDRLSAKLLNYGWNRWFLNRVRRSMDFVGINYYFSNRYQGFKQQNPGSPKNDLGWYMEPSAIGQVITDVWDRYHKPVMITENGVADEDDRVRQWWLEETFSAMHQAMAGGARIIGYMHWSLLDNFEWAFGWWPKFGLIKVDRARGMKRVVRPSAVWLSKYLKKQGR